MFGMPLNLRDDHFLGCERAPQPRATPPVAHFHHQRVRREEAQHTPRCAPDAVTNRGAQSVLEPETRHINGVSQTNRPAASRYADERDELEFGGIAEVGVERHTANRAQSAYH